mmetsp:Transcript_12148/g.24769  ORF Transcript_12148/g.24769 Transcript_12148/m.24769 type:complete len:96 (+) Transcript_12148:156-443(+)
MKGGRSRKKSNGEDTGKGEWRSVAMLNDERGPGEFSKQEKYLEQTTSEVPSPASSHGSIKYKGTLSIFLFQSSSFVGYHPPPTLPSSGKESTSPA